MPREPRRIRIVPQEVASPIDAKAAEDRRTKAKRTAALRQSITTQAKTYRIPRVVRDDIGLTRDEILASAPVLAAAVRPLPPAEPLPPSWRKYFSQMCRYAQAIQYRHRLATKHDLPIDWFDVPVKGGLNDVFNAVFLDVDAVSTILNITTNAASRLMNSGMIPSFKGPSLPLMTTIHDLSVYLSMHRIIDWRVVMHQAGWRQGPFGGWKDPSSGDYLPLSKALATVKKRMDAKFGVKLE